jgi:hypothetical protein
MVQFMRDVEKKLLDFQSHMISQEEVGRTNFQQPNFQKLYLESQDQNIKRLERIVDQQNNIILASIQKPALPLPSATNIIHTTQPSHASNPPIVTTTTARPSFSEASASTAAPASPETINVADPINHNALSATATPFVLPRPTATPVVPPRPSEHANKLRISMVGDSMLGGLQARHHQLKPTGGLISNHHLDVVSHGGKTTEDMVDYVKPVLRRAPNKLIVMTGTNDIRAGVDTLSHAKNLIDTVKATSPTTQLALTEICIRRDKLAPTHRDIADMNNRLAQLCQREQIEFIRTNEFDGRCLSKGRLHPNDNGNDILLKLFNIFINK